MDPLPLDPMQPARDRILAFLRGIGLAVEACTLPDPSFLPGISIDCGVLLFDAAKLAYPGDLLHEAGHLAVVPAAVRRTISGSMDSDGGFEMAAIAWSYAAAVFLQLPLDILFHPAGYRGGAASLRENFSSGRYIGVPMLEWLGMTDPLRPEARGSASTYPVMKKWLCDGCSGPAAAPA